MFKIALLKKAFITYNGQNYYMIKITKGIR